MILLKAYIQFNKFIEELKTNILKLKATTEHLKMSAGFHIHRRIKDFAPKCLDDFNNPR